MLEVEGVHTFYGLSHILFDVSLTVPEGRVVCLLGRNGAGKTTTLKSIMGLTPPSRGRVLFKQEDVTGIKPFRLARKGVGYVPDDRRIFADLTVGENLQIAARGTAGKADDWNSDRVYDLFPQLKAMDRRRGGNLSGGEQKMLAIARALMTNPEFLLLDEPTEGLAPGLVKILGDRIERLKASGLTVLLAEQNVRFTLGLSDYGYIIDNGRIRYQGAVEELTDNPEVRKLCGI
jgi:branched-chain amino acid transport system ATP-binding protein